MDQHLQNQQQPLYQSNLGSQIKEKYHLDTQNQHYSQDLVRSTVAKYANMRPSYQNSQLKSQSAIRSTYTPLSLNNQNQSTIRNTSNMNTIHGNTTHGEFWDNKHNNREADDQLLLKYSSNNNTDTQTHTETVKHHAHHQVDHDDHLVQYEDKHQPSQIQRSQSPIIGKRVEHLYYKAGEYDQLEKAKHSSNHSHNQNQYQDGVKSEIKQSKSPSKSKIVRVIKDGKIISEERVDLEFNNTYEQQTRTTHIESEPKVHHELKQVVNLEPKVQPQVNTRLISSKVIETQQVEENTEEVDENYAVCTIF